MSKKDAQELYYETEKMHNEAFKLETKLKRIKDENKKQSVMSEFVFLMKKIKLNEDTLNMVFN